MARTKNNQKNNNGAKLGFEETLWLAADKQRGHMDAAEYKDVVLGLIFLKYISDAFSEVYNILANQPYADHLEQFRTLATIRDTILAKLLSGEIRVAKTANRKGQADQVIEFIKADFPLAENINKTYTVIKETERPKYLPKDVVKIMQQEGFLRFNMSEHTKLWQDKEAKDSGKGFGVKVATTWYWYEAWIQEVRKHSCAGGSPRNLVQSRSFAQMLEQTIQRYQNRLIETDQVMSELTDILHQEKFMLF